MEYVDLYDEHRNPLGRTRSRAERRGRANTASLWACGFSTTGAKSF
ncbi:MAG: hypothetical protein GX558_01050 [Clostridiales bacterium]|nr:hypothetical protein [Clostridiales bacterium]